MMLSLKKLFLLILSAAFVLNAAKATSQPLQSHDTEAKEVTVLASAIDDHSDCDHSKSQEDEDHHTHKCKMCKCMQCKTPSHMFVISSDLKQKTYSKKTFPYFNKQFNEVLFRDVISPPPKAIS